MIKAVIFDIDGVLLDSYEVNLKYFQDLMLLAGYPPPTRETFDEYFHMGEYDAIRSLTGLTDDKEIKKIQEMGDAKVKYEIERAAMPQGVEEVLKELHSKYLLGIVTNRVHPFEPPQLARFKDLFNVAVGWEDTKKHKPHPDPLQKVAKELDVLSKETVYIGDVENDLKAARAAGTKFIFFPDTGIPGADGTAKRFRELPDLIASL